MKGLGAVQIEAGDYANALITLHKTLLLRQEDDRPGIAHALEDISKVLCRGTRRCAMPFYQPLDQITHKRTHGVP